MNILTFYNNHSPVGDIAVVIIWSIMIILKSLTYSKKDEGLKCFNYAMNCLLIAALSGLVLYYHRETTQVSDFVTFLCTCIQKSFLMFIYMLYIRYSMVVFKPVNLKMRTVKLLAITPGVILNILMFLIPIMFSNLTWIARENIVHNICSIGYIYYIALIVIGSFYVRPFIINTILKILVLVSSISILIILFSFINSNFIFLTFSFFPPLLAAYCILHNNPFNIEMGTLDANNLESYIEELIEKDKDFALVYVILDGQIRATNFVFDIKHEFPELYNKFLSHSYLFKIKDNKYVLAIEKTHIGESGMKEHLTLLASSFHQLYNKYKLDYKLIFINKHEQMDKTHTYTNMYEYLEAKVPTNSVYFCKEEDIKKFLEKTYVLNEIRDIVQNDNLEDERVLVYCQPVLNMETGKFDSAEVLMRLKLPECGMVFPDIFIPIAEEGHYIHSLSLIILHKTCKKIKELLAAGLNISRISVNFSILELKDQEFCSDIMSIIQMNDIPFNKIAIELTESSTEANFKIIKKILHELKEYGMYFYLDDFGSGYSNFDRIMQLPIDIIKFDRSLVIMSNKTDEHKSMVSNLANTFSSFGYKVLFEGIEDENDESMCRSMKANYLQGYKYSKPIPIEQLADYLSPVEESA